MPAHIRATGSNIQEALAEINNWLKKFSEIEQMVKDEYKKGYYIVNGIDTRLYPKNDNYQNLQEWIEFHPILAHKYGQ
jgi:hypothetical protein